MSGPDAGAWGIVPGHHAVDGTWVPAPAAGVAAALAAMEADDVGPPPTRTWVVRADEVVRLPAPAVLVTEDGGSERVTGAIERPPLGYHRLEFDDGAIGLIVSPGRCAQPPRRGWGWAVQLYAARSEQSWGIGDLSDLARLGRWGAGQGASATFVNPLGSAAPGRPAEPSPYFPSSRRWRNPLYLRVEDVPGAASLGAALEALASAGRALNQRRLIDRPRVWELKGQALAQLWGSGLQDEAALARWRAEAGPGLTSFATHAALAEVHGPDWRGWPASVRRPDQAGVARFADGPGAERVRFHCWLQFLLDGQLAAAARAHPLVADLPIGADPTGADAWEWQDQLALDVSVGAPPDEFSPAGQQWGFPPFDPWRLRSAGYHPWIELARAAFAHAGGLRIDHVAGLFRQYWVPNGSDATEGAYVRYPWADLCNILTLEAHRAGAFVVGEDLGTVEPDVRRALAEAGVLTYRLLWFEDEPPADWPEAALAAVTTHDLPTVAGAWSGLDAADRRAAGAPVDAEADRRMLTRLVRAAQVDVEGGSVSDAVSGSYAALAASPCSLVAVTLDDVLEVAERPNVPGTADRANWCLALPSPLEAVEGDQRAAQVSGLMRAARPVVEAEAVP